MKFNFVNYLLNIIIQNQNMYILYIVDLEIKILENLNSKIKIFGFLFVFTCDDPWKLIDIIRNY